ncbi:hypothetical protein B0H17DRAFT_643487 [Mycena rosella]|uniref:F-box domain-containing protein n=1 Tax=Mycena rosella TaxID=1033263 RepID=A0AAD7DDU0_MYCRO|nr:hypothetical protein B0H17DRAFT_643487 [Mycena rosella]
MEEAPISRLPTEILHEIFSMAAAVPSEELATLASDYAPWVLGHVCERWRAAAISHASIWSTISIRRNRPPPIALLDRQLQLSADVPLTILFYQSENERCIGLFEALVARSRRWSQLSVTLLQDASPFLKALERVRGQIPILRTLALEGWATTTGNPFAFEVAPELEDVTLRFRPLPIIPWRQLTRLSVTCSFSSLLPVLELAQNVTELTVHLLDHSALSDSPQRIHMPLVSRCLLFHRRIMDVLVLPQLEIFIIEPDTAAALVPLLQRSSCSLKKLGLYGHCSMDTVTTVLQACPALAEITVVCLEGTAYLDVLIAHLSKRTLPNDESTLAVPDLKRIFMMADSIDQARFVDMVESRWRIPDSSHRLEQVTVLLNEKWDSTSLRRLSVLQNEGMEVMT